MSEPPLPLVLVVNDAEEVRELTVAALEDGGYALFAASAANEAFALLGRPAGISRAWPAN